MQDHRPNAFVERREALYEQDQAAVREIRQDATGQVDRSPAPQALCPPYRDREKTILHLASDESSFMTGSVIAADGGHTSW